MMSVFRVSRRRYILAIAGVAIGLMSAHAFAPRPFKSHAAVVKHCTTVLSMGSKWDNLVDEDDEQQPPIPRDMVYNPTNIMRAHQSFYAIRDAGGAELTNDLYVREPGNQVFWFAGKVARVSDVSVEQAVARQWSLIEQHAANLRPIELYPHVGVLEIWTAPGDSEVDVAYNRPSVVMQKMNRNVKVDGVNKVMVGFSGEVYDQGEEGFRTLRTNDGRPAKPEVQSASEPRTPTDEEMAELNKRLEGQDLNELYKEQQRREGKAES